MSCVCPKRWDRQYSGSSRTCGDWTMVVRGGHRHGYAKWSATITRRGRVRWYRDFSSELQAKLAATRVHRYMCTGKTLDVRGRRM